MKKIALPNLPEFSNENYTIAGYIVASLITLSGGFFIYEVLFNSDLTFSANWNMFNSPLGNVCMCIGFVCAIVFWGKMGHWSRTPVIEYRDSSGRLVGAKEDMDVTEQGFAKILLPILGHFVFEPIIYGAIIYYPIQCVIALVGTIFPYVLSLIVLAIMVGSWFFTPKLNFRYHSIVLVLLGVLFTIAFCWGGFTLQNTEPGSTISMLASTTQQDNGNAAAQQTQQDAPNTYNEFDESASSDFEEDEGSLWLVAEVGPVPAGGREGLFGDMLAANAFGLGTKGAVLSLDAVKDAIFLHRHCPPGMEYPDFEHVLFTPSHNSRDWLSRACLEYSPILQLSACHT